MTDTRTSLGDNYVNNAVIWFCKQSDRVILSEICKRNNAQSETKSSYGKVNRDHDRLSNQIVISTHQLSYQTKLGLKQDLQLKKGITKTNTEKTKQTSAKIQNDLSPFSGKLVGEKES